MLTYIFFYTWNLGLKYAGLWKVGLIGVDREQANGLLIVQLRCVQYVITDSASFRILNITLT